MTDIDFVFCTGTRGVGKGILCVDLAEPNIERAEKLRVSGWTLHN